ncbi:hypothetical protein P5673_000106 [Acropora cervicornis]|uniref:Uncharacterized protein n=1 Tax=Acropora cervicornis TaxID=6130 RepID=A0AAD9VHE2_ACRCE|nr:hypothetical protein P5673_000106 [Acropora cervicornis]
MLAFDSDSLLAMVRRMLLLGRSVYSVPLDADCGLGATGLASETYPWDLWLGSALDSSDMSQGVSVPQETLELILWDQCANGYYDQSSLLGSGKYPNGEVPNEEVWFIEFACTLLGGVFLVYVTSTRDSES